MRTSLRQFVRALISAVLLLLSARASEGADAGRAGLDGAAGMYREMCAVCHGTGGKGDGPAAEGMAVKPRDHTDAAYMNSLTDAQVFEIISRGGAAVGKFAGMPAWGQALSEQQIWDLVRYIRSLHGSRP